MNIKDKIEDEREFININYLKAASLLSNWMDEKSDYDNKIWPKLKKKIALLKK